MSVMPLILAFVDAARGDAAHHELIGRMATHLFSLRSLSLSIVDALANGRDAAVESALTKDLGTRFEQEITEAIRVAFDAEPDASPGGVSQLLAQAIIASPNFTLRGGTNEILRGIVAASVVGR